MKSIVITLVFLGLIVGMARAGEWDKDIDALESEIRAEKQQNNTQLNHNNNQALNYKALLTLGLEKKLLLYNHAYSFNSIPAQLSKIIIIPARDSDKLRVKAGSKVALFAPSGEFLVVHYANGNDFIYPQKLNTGFDKQPVFNLTTLTKDAYLYAGYFYPEKDTIDKINPGIFEFLVYVDDTNAKSGDDEKLSPFAENPQIYWVSPEARYVFHGIGIIAILIWFWFVKEHIKSSRQEAEKMGKSEKFISLRAAYKKNPNNPLLCIYCGNLLQTVDLFNCPAGHVPKQPQSIFKKCGVDGCPYEFSNITCNHCGSTISLNKDKYNQEEIQNRGKEKILRIHPAKRGIATMLCVIGIIILILMYLISHVLLLNGPITKEAAMYNYKDIHGYFAYYNHINPLPYYGFALILFSIIIYLIIIKMDNVLVGNPYE